MSETTPAYIAMHALDGKTLNFKLAYVLALQAAGSANSKDAVSVFDTALSRFNQFDKDVPPRP